MNVSALTLLILQVNKLVDSGNYDEITIGDIHMAIEKKKLLRYLKEKAGQDIDLSVHLDSNAFGNFEEYYENEMNIFYNTYAGEESRKWGVKKRGLSLVIAWTNEIVQQGINLKWE